MEKVIALVSEDEEYGAHLKEFLNTREGFGFRTVAFTGEDSLKTYLKSNPVEVLLCDEYLVRDGIGSRLDIPHTYALSEYNFIDECLDIKTIFKYHSGKAIAEEIMQLYVDEGGYLDGEGLVRANGLVAVCSPEGGCYKSTFALSYALRCSREKRTLFVSFDPFLTLFSQKKDSNTQGLTDIVYYMAEDPERLESKISAVISHVDRLDYIAGVAHWYDIFDFSLGRMRAFIETVTSRMGYDLVVVDVGEFDVASMEILAASDIIYVPGRNTGAGMDKYEEWLRQLRFISGEALFGKLKRIIVPYDSELEETGFRMEKLLGGKLGAFVEECLTAMYRQESSAVNRPAV